MRLVLDTNVVASALLWGGKPARLLQVAREKRVELFASTHMLAELTDILGRRMFEAKISASLLSIDQIVDRYAQLALLVHPVTVAGIAPDPDDDVVIGTALAAKADFIVTGDQPLLTILEHQGIRIVKVAGTLHTLGLIA
jgi:uncharacterized protein